MSGQENPNENNEPATQQTQPESTPSAQQTIEPAAQQTQVPPAPAAQQQAQPADTGNTVNRYKYERDVAKLQDENAALKAENEGYKALKEEFEQFKSSQEAEKADKALKDAGCIDTVAASARLNEFDGDIEKLKEEAPYLFASSDKSKSTGGNPKGKPDPEDERTKNMREIMGLDTDKE